MQLLTGRGRLTARPDWLALSKTMAAMVGVMSATGAGRSTTWLGSVGPAVVDVGVLVEVDPDPLSWIWTARGVTMLWW